MKRKKLFLEDLNQWPKDGERIMHFSGLTTELGKRGSERRDALQRCESLSYKQINPEPRKTF